MPENKTTTLIRPEGLDERFRVAAGEIDKVLDAIDAAKDVARNGRARDLVMVEMLLDALPLDRDQTSYARNRIQSVRTLIVSDKGDRNAARYELGELRKKVNLWADGWGVNLGRPVTNNN